MQRVDFIEQFSNTPNPVTKRFEDSLWTKEWAIQRDHSEGVFH